MEKKASKIVFIIFFCFFTLMGMFWFYLVALGFLEPSGKFSVANFYLLILIILMYHVYIRFYIKGITGHNPGPKYFISGIFLSGLLAGIIGVTLFWNIVYSGQGVFTNVGAIEIIMVIVTLCLCLINAVISIGSLLSNYTIAPKEKRAPESEAAEDEAKEAQAE